MIFSRFFYKKKKRFSKETEILFIYFLPKETESLMGAGCGDKVLIITRISFWKHFLSERAKK